MSTLTSAEIERRFTYHRPEGQKIQAHEDVRRLFKQFAVAINIDIPACREAEIGFQKLEEAANWFHAAIARPHVERVEIWRDPKGMIHAILPGVQLVREGWEHVSDYDVPPEGRPQRVEPSG